jgi:hypothetical protein
MIYSKYCDNPESMIILDPFTGIKYSQDETQGLNKIIKSRLVNRCLKQGYKVLSLEECNILLNKRYYSGETEVGLWSVTKEK